jgi:rhamnogalacturonyl hydrolase YesR
MKHHYLWNTALLTGALCLLLTNVGCQTLSQTPADFGNWPAGASPQEIGRRVTENYLARKFDFETNPRRTYVIYPEVCGGYGALTTAKLIGDTTLRDRVVKKFERFVTPDWAKYVPTNAHVDYRVFGSVPLEIYLQTKDARFLELGKSLADKQWETTTPDGITTEARYWVDDMYMILILQIQAYRATGEAKYLDRAALTAVAYLDKLQQTNGLFFHAPDVPFYWSRGNGWFAVGMSEMLRSLPSKHPQRARILAGYRTMMASLLKYQGQDGLWHQLIDHPESWSETSGTGMFTYAMICGVKNGWLDAAVYGPAARKGWLGLVACLNPDANIRDVCEGTNKKNDLEYYLVRARRVGDLHGQSPVLWCASALLRPAGQ